ncbi:Asp23/Gls24 family envelope stress response protein [Nocardia blacklockiae]|uniref:Asp23/Gls24 family envelope stress response protein n=1 Tax=Nocardia blacklockiae TaxID=480036 RepID=UPI001895E058|nr:Asp23/Gls24 family envelope stress response protein [Nocardia blacklockiae]MBF6174861.1 Asp23/Gls24 family envelope stress response protein [Nocardia blacklockiae]
MAVTQSTDSDYLLPCGRGLEQVWERLDALDAGLADEHERTCPHCAAARESLLTLRGATRELVDEPDPPPPALFGRIMTAVRTEVRRGRTVELPTAEPGSIEVSEQAVAVVLRYAADTVDGVRARHCHVRSAGPGPDGETAVEVEMTIAVRAGGRPVERLVAQVRERVRAAASARIGLLVQRIDIGVADLYEEDR